MRSRGQLPGQRAVFKRSGSSVDSLDMQDSGNTRTVLNGTRPGVGATATSYLVASALQATLHSTDDQIKFGGSPLDVYDVGDLISSHMTPSVIVSGTSLEDLSIVKENRDLCIGIIVLHEAEICPYSFAERAGVCFLGQQIWHQSVGDAYRSGIFRCGYHIASGLSLHPNFARRANCGV